MDTFTSSLETIINKLTKGVRFGLYDGGKNCYFEDGTKVNYHELWAAIRIIKKLEPSHKKTLFGLYPDLFMGTFSRKFSRYRLTGKVFIWNIWAG